jgi:hypothetical protein
VFAYQEYTICPKTFIGIALGTVDKKVWKEGLAGDGGQLGEMLKHMADFKRVLKLEVEPGGWYPAERDKPG